MPCIIALRNDSLFIMAFPPAPPVRPAVVEPGWREVPLPLCAPASLAISSMLGFCAIKISASKLISMSLTGNTSLVEDGVSTRLSTSSTKSSTRLAMYWGPVTTNMLFRVSTLRAALGASWSAPPPAPPPPPTRAFSICCCIRCSAFPPPRPWPLDSSEPFSTAARLARTMPSRVSGSMY